MPKFKITEKEDKQPKGAIPKLNITLEQLAASLSKLENTEGLNKLLKAIEGLNSLEGILDKLNGVTKTLENRDKQIEELFNKLNTLLEAIPKKDNTSTDIVQLNDTILKLIKQQQANTGSKEITALTITINNLVASLDASKAKPKEVNEAVLNELLVNSKQTNELLTKLTQPKKVKVVRGLDGLINYVEQI